MSATITIAEDLLCELVAVAEPVLLVKEKELEEWEGGDPDSDEWSACDDEYGELHRPVTVAKALLADAKKQHLEG